MSDWWSPPMEKGSGRRSGSDRKPLRFWQPFNDWWRAQYEATGKRPTSDDIAKWYDADSDTAWGQEKPSLLETRTHAKCLRSVESVRDYFRDYRAKKKQENSDHDDRSDDTDMMRHSQADNASQQTASHSGAAGGTPCSKSRHNEDVQPIPPGSDSGGRGSGSGGRGRGRRGRGRGGKVGRGRGGYAHEHVPYQNMGAYAMYQPSTASNQYGMEQLGEVHPGALAGGANLAMYQQYPQYMLMQQDAQQQAGGSQPAYMPMQQQHASQDTLGYQQPYMQMQQFGQSTTVSSQQPYMQPTAGPAAAGQEDRVPHPGALVQPAPEGRPEMQQQETTTAAAPAMQSAPLQQQASATMNAPAQQPAMHQQQAAAAMPGPVVAPTAKQQQPPDAAGAPMQQPIQQQQPTAPNAAATAPAEGQQLPAAPAAIAPTGQPVQQQAQQQADNNLTLRAPSLQTPTTAASAAPAGTPAAPNSNSTQPPRTNTHNLQLPRGGSIGLPSLFSPTLGSLDFGRMSSLGFDKAFSLDMAGLQGLPLWVSDLGTLDTTTPRNFNPANPPSEVAAAGAASLGQQSHAGTHPGAQQRTAAAAAPAQLPAPGVAVKLELPTQHNAHVAAQHQPQYQLQQQYQGHQARPEYTNPQVQGRMLPPPALGAQYMWHQQQQQMQMQRAQQQAQAYMLAAAAQQVKQEPQSQHAGYAIMPGHMQQEHYMQAWPGMAGSVGAAGGYNDVFSQNPHIGYGTNGPAPPSSQFSQFSQPGVSAGPAQPPAAVPLATSTSRYHMAAPPPLAVPSAAGSSAPPPRPRRSFQNGAAIASGYGPPGQPAGHNAAGILSELEAIKGPAMQGLMDVHTANQQHRISVSALLDSGAFGPAARRMSQALDPSTTPHHRLSLYALGSDAIDILGLESLDLDTFLGTGGGHGDNGNNEMIAPIAPGSRTAVRIQGDPLGHWPGPSPMATGAFGSLPTGMPQAPTPPPASAAAQPHQAGPQAQQQVAIKPESGAAVTHGMLSPPVRTSSTGETAWTGAGRSGSAADSSGVPATPGQKRKRGLVLDLGNPMKQQRVSGLLMELDTPRVRTLAGPLLSPRPGGGLPTGRHPWGSTPGRPLSTRHKVVLDLRSPATRQQEQQQAQEQQQQQQPVAEVPATLGAAYNSSNPAALVAPNPAAGSEPQQPVQQQPGPVVPKQLRVLNLADDPLPPAAAVAPLAAGAALAVGVPSVSQAMTGPTAWDPAVAAAPGTVSGLATAGTQPVAPPMTSQAMLNPTLSGSGGSLGTALSGDGAVAQVTVGRMGGKGFLPAMHEIEKMI